MNSISIVVIVAAGVSFAIPCFLFIQKTLHENNKPIVEVERNSRGLQSYFVCERFYTSSDAPIRQSFDKTLNKLSTIKGKLVSKVEN